MVADIAADVRRGTRTARSVIDDALGRVAARDPHINAVTRVLTDRARATAAVVDAAVAAGRDPGPLAGVPFGVKDLFDIEIDAPRMLALSVTMYHLLWRKGVRAVNRLKPAPRR